MPKRVSLANQSLQLGCAYKLQCGTHNEVLGLQFLQLVRNRSMTAFGWKTCELVISKGEEWSTCSWCWLVKLVHDRKQQTRSDSYNSKPFPRLAT